MNRRAPIRSGGEMLTALDTFMQLPWRRGPQTVGHLRKYGYRETIKTELPDTHEEPSARSALFAGGA